MTALICDRCNTEIFPGSKVEIIGPNADDRIVLEGDALIVHATCPEPAIPNTTNPLHTRDPGEGAEQATDWEGKMLCNDCLAPLFYCSEKQWYFHVDPAAPACFLSNSDHLYTESA
jgi:hypothetical protein